MKSTLRWVLPFAVTAAILIYLLQTIGLGDIVDKMSVEAASVLLPVIIAYASLSLWFEGASLTRLTEHAGRHASLGTCARIKAASYTVGLINYALGVAALALLFRRRVGLGLSAATGLVATVSVADLVVMMTMAAMSAVVATGQPAALQFGLIGGIVGVLLAGLLFLRAPWSLGVLDRVRDLELFRTVRGAPWSLLGTLALLRLGFVSTFIAAGAGSFYAFGVHPPLAELVIGLSAVALVGALPIAIGGLGTVQAAVIYLFDDWGEPDTLVACSLAMQATMTLTRMTIGLVFAREFTREAVQASREGEQ